MTFLVRYQLNQTFFDWCSTWNSRIGNLVVCDYDSIMALLRDRWL